MTIAKVFENGRSQAVRLPKEFRFQMILWLIAAHAKALNLTLVTNNTKEFARVDELALDDWV